MKRRSLCLSPSPRLALHHNHCHRTPQDKRGDSAQDNGLSNTKSSTSKEGSGEDKSSGRPFLDALINLLGSSSVRKKKSKAVTQESQSLEEKAPKTTYSHTSRGGVNWKHASPVEANIESASDSPIRGQTEYSSYTPPKVQTETASYTPVRARNNGETIPGALLQLIGTEGQRKGSNFNVYVVRRQGKHYQSGRWHGDNLDAQWASYAAYNARQTQRNSVSMKAYIQFVSVPTGDTPGTCILLHHDNKRYLFGHLGEGSMRAFNELGLSMRKVQKIFISGKTTRETTGGLLGTVLTLADANSHAHQSDLSKNKKIEDVDIYGPPNLVHSVVAARKFVFRKSTPTTIRDLDDTPHARNEQGEWLPRVFDENIDVFTIAVNPTPKPATEASTLDGESEQSKDLIRQRIVNDMFNSTWRLDTMVEQPLGEVRLPAKLWVRNPITKDLEDYNGPLPPDPRANLFQSVFVRNPWPAATVTALPPTTQRPEAISYIVRGRMLRGKFDKTRADQLKIPKGPLFSKLAKGEDITLADGTVIQSNQVVGPDVQGGGFAVFDLPAVDYVEDFLKKEELYSDRVMAGVETYIWILGPGVSASPALQTFIRRANAIYHIITSPDHNPNKLVAHGAATSAINLAQVDRESFPVPYFDDGITPAPSFRRTCGFLPDTVDPQAKLFSLTNARLGERGLSMQLDPKRKLGPETIVPDLDALALLSAPQSTEVIELAKRVRESAQAGPLYLELDEWRAVMRGRDAEIITLGTGSAMPSKYRNVSATLVRVPNFGSYLLDAGENTLGQLQRVYKPHELMEVLRDLRMIWISHGHADHHLGTVSMIKAWYEVVHGSSTSCPPMSRQVLESLTEKYDDMKLHLRVRKGSRDVPRHKYLAVMGNRFLMDYLRDLSSVEDFGYSHVLPMLNIMAPGRSSSRDEVSKRTQVILTEPNEWLTSPLSTSAQLGLTGVIKIRAVNVNHCNGARAIYLHFGPNGFSVAYSGDCRPSGKFAEAAKHATVLIHEATFDDELQGEARAKKHSTVQEAIGVASLMQAKSLILTHFSQRYQKIPVLDNIWGKAEKVKARIQTEGVRDDEEHVAHGPGAGEDVDEVAADGEKAETTTDLQEADSAETEPTEEEREIDSDIELSDAEAPKREMPILFAFDYMRVRVRDMPMLRAYRPALTKLFEDDIVELEERKAKKAKQILAEQELKNNKRASIGYGNGEERKEKKAKEDPAPAASDW